MATHDGIHEIEPQWEKIQLTGHSIQRFSKRASGSADVTRDTIVWILKGVVMHGRRSDRDFRLVTDLKHWTQGINWESEGRKVVLWYYLGVGVLCVQDKYDASGLVALTCFTTIEFVDSRETQARLKVLHPGITEEVA